MKKTFIAIPLIFLASCGVFERDNSNYWLNNVRSYKTFPITFYDSQTVTDEKLTNTETLNTHTYKHNTLVSANLGQRMVDAQTYTVKNYTREKIVANADGSLYTTGVTLNINKGDIFLPLGEVKINGRYYLLITPQNDGNIALIDENGYFANMVAQLYRGELLISNEAAVVRPENLGVTMDKDVREATGTPQPQFEIKYDGLENDMMAFIYTDYSNATSSQGYFQRFVFPKEQSLVNINNVKFKIMDVYPERIEYMILD